MQFIKRWITNEKRSCARYPNALQPGLSYLEVEHICKRLKIEGQNREVKRKASFDISMHDDNLKEWSSDFEYHEKVEDFLCGPSNNGRWHITGPYKI